MKEGSGISFNPLKLTSGFGKGNEVGDYLKGMTEASATLAKEAVHVTEPTQVKFSKLCHYVHPLKKIIMLFIGLLQLGALATRTLYL